MVPENRHIFRELIWKKKQSRIQLRILQLPKDRGGLAVPHPWSYFLAAQLQHFEDCNVSSKVGTDGGIMLPGMSHNTLTEALDADSFPSRLLTIVLVKRVWRVRRY